MDPVMPVAHGGMDFSAWSLFLQADIVVKTVMVGLVLASVWSWAIMIDKGRLMRRLRAGAARFEADFWSDASLDALYDRYARANDPYAVVFRAGMDEWRRSHAGAGRGDGGWFLRRIGTAMRSAFEREMDRIETRLGFLATLGATAPFVGLFGTVWGIMRAFTAIAQTQNTTLAVVAPGIAEALFATAIGLAAAIPAVIGYNKFTGDAGRYGSRLANFCDEFEALFSRELERGGSAASGRAAQ